MKSKNTSKKVKDGAKLPRIISDNGDLFIVQTNDRRIALGLIARGGRTAGKLGYFFRIELLDQAKEKNALVLEPEQAIWIAMFGDLHILRGKWPLIGKLNGFTRESWPMPVFVHHHEGFNINYVRTYDENNLEMLGNWPESQVPAHIDTSFQVEDGLAGAEYVENYLMKILGLRNQ
jgi:hypothetical protein